MESLVIVMIATAFLMLIWVLSLVAKENQYLRNQNREQKYDIRKLTNENVELMDEIFELNKQIRTAIK
jgi:cell division protein FtsL